MMLLALVAAAAAAPLRPGADNTWLAGAASVSVLPTVNGTTSYWKQYDDSDATSAGTFILEFDQGRIPIGNGANDGAHWVRDDVRASALALRGSNDITLVFLHSDLYMLFAGDLADYYELVRQAVGDAVYANLRFSVSATHNHEGPDTSGLSVINPRYYAYMLEQLSIATVAALGKMEPATLVASDIDWRFGQGDYRDPRVVDPTMNVLQARSIATGAVLATMVQWTMHPEIIMYFNSYVPNEECVAAGLAAPCTGRSRTITGDFPGQLQANLKRLVGGEVLYINGAVGVQIGPGNNNRITPSPVWEVTDDYPITGDGAEMPANATQIPINFRHSFMIGRETALQAIRALSNSRAFTVPFLPIEYRRLDFFTRISNLFYRAGLAPGRILDRPLLLGYNMREMYTCTPGVPASFETCESDNFETVTYNGFGLPVRKGDFATSYITHIRIGDLQMLSVPGELAPELAHGLPLDFDTAPAENYYLRPEIHTTGAAYKLEGVTKDMMKCKYCWIFGLTHDASGYIFPIADWRMTCRGTEVCEAGGYITGDTCKAELDSGSREGPVFEECYTGQTSQWETHYEEINAVSWDVAGDYIGAVSRLLGVPPSGRYTKADWTQ